MQGTPPGFLLSPVCDVLQHPLSCSLSSPCPVVFLLVPSHSSRCLVGCLNDLLLCNPLTRHCLPQWHRAVLLISLLLLCRCAVPVLLRFAQQPPKGQGVF